MMVMMALICVLVVFIEYIDVCPCDEQTYRPVLFLYSEQLQYSVNYCYALSTVRLC